MPDKPEIVLRLGSHAEKEYFIKLARQVDGLVFGANLLEITKVATASLAIKLRAGGIPWFCLDPITYAFGEFYDPIRRAVRNDLEWIKSDPPKKKPELGRRVKKSYRLLAAELGGVFQEAVESEKSISVHNDIVLQKRVDSVTKSVLDYQRGRLHSIIVEDEEMAAMIDEDHLRPRALFAPYFYIANEWMEDGINACLEFAMSAVAQAGSDRIDLVFCASRELLLQDATTLEILGKELAATGVSGVWLWFSKFDELEAGQQELDGFRSLVMSLGKSVDVYNMHGGYFSLMLFHDGLKGIGHSVGYGERKVAAQVIGPGVPTVRYYLPAIHKRIGVPAIQRSFPSQGIDSAEAFHDKVCGCTICRGVLNGNVGNFQAFGEMHRSREDSQRATQTPTAAKMCRYHFLLSRFLEREEVSKVKREGRARLLSTQAGTWPNEATVASDGSHIQRWVTALDGDSNDEEL